MPDQTFAELGLSADVIGALSAQGIETPFQIQTRVIPAALAGADILAKAPTGSGKTLAFAVPIVEHLNPADGRPAALILVPTRELCVQVTEVLETLTPARASRSPPSMEAFRSGPRPTRPSGPTCSWRLPDACRT